MLFESISPSSQIATEPRSNSATLCKDCNEARHGPLATLRDTVTRFTPLELAACLYLVKAYMHRDLYTYHCESDHCRVSAVSATSTQKIATIALALLILNLSIIDWHVPL